MQHYEKSIYPNTSPEWDYYHRRTGAELFRFIRKFGSNRLHHRKCLRTTRHYRSLQQHPQRLPDESKHPAGGEAAGQAGAGGLPVRGYLLRILRQDA